MQQPTYHTQIITKACKYCARPFMGHPNRDYCSYRCKRKAKESRFRTISGPMAEEFQEFARNYDVVTPETAISIFEYLDTTADDAVTVTDFMEPERVIVPANVRISYNGKRFEVRKVPPNLAAPSSRPLLDELAETSSTIFYMQPELSQKYPVKL